MVECAWHHEMSLCNIVLTLGNKVVLFYSLVSVLLQKNSHPVLLVS